MTGEILQALFTLFFVFVSLAGISQEAQNLPLEGRIWIGAGAQFRLNKDWNLQVDEQLRLNAEGRSFQQILTELQLEYEIGKRAAVFQEYRFSVRQIGLTHRLATGISYRVVEAKPWYLSMRGKYQHDFTGTNPDEGNWRTKAQLRYRINKRWNVYASAENWTAIYPVAKISGRIRSGAGVGLERKHNEIRWQYYFERSIANAWFDPGQSHILALTYTRTP